MASTLGIYFGPKLIVVVESKGKKINNYIKIPRSALAEAELEEKVPEDVKMAAIFNDELRRNNIEAREASICLPGRDLIVRSFELPALPANELSNAVNFEAKKYIPFKAEDLVSDFQIEFDKASRRNLILYLGIKKDTLERYLAILRQLNINVEFIDYSAFSVLRFFKLTGMGRKGVVGLISMDSREDDEANFSVLEDGFPVFSRDLTLISGPGELLKPEETSPAMLLEKIKTEIRISLDYYHRKFPTKTIENVFFITDESYRSDLEYYMKDMDITAKFIDVNRYIEKQVPFSLSFIKGYGSSLSKTVKTNLKLNLLAPKGKVKAEKIPKKAAVMPGEVDLKSLLKLDPKFVALGLLICGAAFGYGFYRTMPVRNEIKNIIEARSKLSGVNPNSSLDELKTADSDYKNKLSVIKNIVSRQLYFTEALEAISRSIPDDMWLTDIDFKETGANKVELTLKGTAHLADSEKELQLINTYVNGLKGNIVFGKYFLDISILSVEQRQAGQVTLSNFTISCRNSK